MNSRTARILEAHYAQITATASSVSDAILFGRFLYCQAIQAELMGSFGVWFIRFPIVA